MFLATAGPMHLAEVADFVAYGDARLAKLGAVAIGGYAMPFAADELK